jgi:hypothetical protein
MAVIELSLLIVTVDTCNRMQNPKIENLAMNAV